MVKRYGLPAWSSRARGLTAAASSIIIVMSIANINKFSFLCDLSFTM